MDLGLTKKIDRTELVLITHRHEEVPYEVQKVVGVKDLDIGELVTPFGLVCWGV